MNEQSSEAPVMILSYEGRRFVPGCAANTIMNLRHLGADVVPIGILGDDEPGEANLGRQDDRHALVAARSRPSAEDEGVSVQLGSELLGLLGRRPAKRSGPGALHFVVAAFGPTEKLQRGGLNARRIERYVSAVREGGATPVVVLNKVDVAASDAQDPSAVCAPLADRLGVPAPPFARRAREGRRATDKRCSNARLLATGFRLRYPTYREGYAALLDEGGR